MNTTYPLPLDTTYPLPLDTAYRSSETESEPLCVTRSLTSELFTPYKEPEREFRSSRRHFKTLSLDELRSPDFNLRSDQEFSEEEVAKTIAETMDRDSLDGLDVPTRQIHDSRGAIPSKTTAERKNTNPLYQERRQSMKDTLRKFMSESAKRHGENSNSIKEIRAATDAAIRNQGA
ncbi:hypothetical protein Tco_1536309 [Tanacetum coccineum]